MMHLQTDLRAFIESLNAANVKYLVVGGYAVAFHGRPRYTGDIDFFVEISPENAARIIEAINRFGFGSTGVKTKDFLESDSFIQFGRDPNRIDVTTGIDGVTWDQAWATRVPSQIDGLPVHFISRDLLLQNKTAAGRPKYLGDVASLRDIESAKPKLK